MMANREFLLRMDEFLLNASARPQRDQFKGGMLVPLMATLDDQPPVGNGWLSEQSMQHRLSARLRPSLQLSAGQLPASRRYLSAGHYLATTCIRRLLQVPPFTHPFLLVPTFTHPFLQVATPIHQLHLVRVPLRQSIRGTSTQRSFLPTRPTQRSFLPTTPIHRSRLPQVLTHRRHPRAGSLALITPRIRISASHAG